MEERPPIWRVAAKILNKHWRTADNINTDNNLFEGVEVFRYMGTFLRNQNSFLEEIKSRLVPGNACYHSVQNLLSSDLSSPNIRIKIYTTIILSVALYGCETWPPTLREERRLRVFENRVLRRIFGPKRDGVTRDWCKLHHEELNDLYFLNKYYSGNQIERN